MISKIEQSIDDLEEYIDNCKYKAFSTDVILVNKHEIDEFIRELRLKTPEDIKKYKKIVSNKDAILEDARKKAQDMLEEAAVQTNELISEHQIMQQAYSQANEIVEMATRQAQEILDNATIEANAVKASAMQYTDHMLANLENVLKQSIEITTRDYNTMVGHLREIDKVVTTNRAELSPAEELEEEVMQENANEEIDNM